MNYFHVAFCCYHRWSPKISQIIVVMLQSFVSVLTSNFSEFMLYLWASQVALVVKNPPANAGNIRDMGSIPGSERSLEKRMATLSIIFARRLSWTEEPGGPQPMRSQRVGHYWSNITFTHVGFIYGNHSLTSHLGESEDRYQVWNPPKASGMSDCHRYCLRSNRSRRY